MFFPDWQTRFFNSWWCEDVSKSFLTCRDYARQISNIFPSHSEWFYAKNLLLWIQWRAEDIQETHSSWSSVPAAWLQSVTEAEFFVKTSVSAYLVGSKTPKIKSSLKPSNWGDTFCFILNFLFHSIFLDKKWREKNSQPLQNFIFQWCWYTQQYLPWHSRKPFIFHFKLLSKWCYSTFFPFIFLKWQDVFSRNSSICCMKILWGKTPVS